MNSNTIGNLKLTADQISMEIREIYRSDTDQAEKTIETYLNLILKGLSDDEKQSVMEKLKCAFPFTPPAPKAPEILPEDLVPEKEEQRSEPEPPAEPEQVEISSPVAEGDANDISDSSVPEDSKDTEDIAQFFSLLLGRDIPANPSSSRELVERLSDSLNTIFNSLNELVGAINTSIMGDYSDDRTIRQLISYHLGEEKDLDALADYIGKIKQTFLLTQQAFKLSARTTVENILKEFDPEKIKAEADSGFGFGAMKKAQYFKAFEKKYDLCKKWFDSDRFMETFLREFEKNCQNQTETMKQ